MTLNPRQRGYHATIHIKRPLNYPINMVSHGNTISLAEQKLL